MKSAILATLASTIGVALSARTITTVNFQGKGFSDQSFGAHLHAAPCSANGGGHYKYDATGAVDAVNENWPAVTCNSKGKCVGEASNYWAPRAADLASGLSIVIHNTPNTNEKMLCADLVQDGPGEYSGSFDYLPDFNQSNGYGSVKKDWATLTTLGLSVAINFGLRFPGEFGPDFYGAHLHADTCANNNGGAHYAGGDGTTIDAVNENWPGATCDNKGNCAGYASSDWAPTEAEFAAGLSVVVHNTSNGNAKMLCADLTMESPGVYSGEFGFVPSYSPLCCGDIETGMAKVSKTVTATAISFKDADFGTNTFASHLHADTCENSGGGHYHGGDATTVDAVNENWPILTCVSGECSGMAVSDWLIPPKDLMNGLSFVVHNTPNTNEKMLCSDISSNDKRGVYKGDKFDFLDSFTTAAYGYPSKPKKSVSLLSVTTVAAQQKAGKGGKNRKNRKGKKGRLAMVDVLGQSGTSLAIGASAGLLVVGVAAVALRRRSARSSEYTPLTNAVGEV